MFSALKDLEGYVDWWPEIKRVDKLAEGRFDVTARSFLPYELRFVTTQSVLDETTGMIEADLRGHLNGFSRWTLRESDGGTIAVFEEEVDTAKGLLNALAPVARAAFRYNHTLMMRHGEAGLRELLRSG